MKINSLRYFKQISNGTLLAALLLLAACSADKTEQEMLANARAHIYTGKLNAAAIELRNTLLKNNNNAEARFLLGSISLKLDYLSGAEKEFRHAASAGWDAQQTQYQLARTLLARMKSQVLLDEIDVADDWPPMVKANITALRAMAERNLNKTDAAVVTLQTAASYDKNAAEVLKATVLLQLDGAMEGDPAATVDKALSLYPDDIELQQLQATVDLENGDIERASETLQKIIQLDPDGLLTRDGRIARIDMARIQIAQDQLDAARQTLGPLFKKNGNDPVANYLMSLLEFNLGDYEKAEMHMRRLLKVVPDDVQSQELMGNIKFLLQDYDQAAHHLTTSLNYSPENLLIYKLLARSYIELHRPAKARFIIERALAVKPDDAELLTMLGQLKINQGDKAAGINTIKKAIKLNPKNAVLQKQLAIAFIKQGMIDKANAAIYRFEQLSKDHEEASKLYIRAALQTGMLERAIIIAAKLMESSPEKPEVLALNGNLQAANKNYPLAKDYFNRALQLDSELPSAIIGLARIEEVNGDLDKAASYYQRLTSQERGGVIPLLALSDIAARQNRIDDMLHWLETARAKTPDDIRSRAILASYYLQQSDLKKASKYILEAIEISPEDPDLLLQQGNILIAQQQYEASLLPLETLIRKSPESSEAKLLLASVYLNLGRYSDARKLLRGVLNVQADNMSALELLAKTERQDRNFEQSLVYAGRMQKLQADSPLGYLQEGQTWLAKKNYQNALVAFQKAWQQKPASDIAELLYEAAQHVQPFEEAIKPLLGWLEQNPNDDSARLTLAYAYLSSGRHDAAIREYLHLLDNNPDNSTALNNLAWLYSMSGDAEALEYAERAFRLSPNDPGILDTYGWILVTQGKTDKGINMLELAMKKLPGNPEILYHYAAALIRSGEHAQGRELLKQLLDSNIDFPDREQAQNLLRDNQ